MSEIKVNNIQSSSGANGPVVSGITTMASSGAMLLPRGDTAYRGGRGRGLVAGGNNGATVDTIEYVTIATEGSSKDFGNLVVTDTAIASFSSSTRGLFAGGQNPNHNNTIQYVTISTTGNAFDFGDLTVGRDFASGLSNSIRGYVCGGRSASPATATKVVDVSTIATLGILLVLES